MYKEIENMDQPSFIFVDEDLEQDDEDIFYSANNENIKNKIQK